MEKINCKGWLVFDLECNMKPENEVRGSFYKRASRMLCVVTKDVVTGDVKTYGTGEEEPLIEALSNAPRVIAHNGRDFDLPALGNIFPDHNNFFRSLPLIDTRWAALKSNNSPNGIYTYSQLSDFDKKFGYPETKQPNSVRAWGHRLKIPMIEEFSDVNWETQPYTEELGEYCKVDVEITHKLFKHIMNKRGFEVG